MWPIPAWLQAQPAHENDWDHLKRLSPGQRVEVIEINLKRTQGNWAEVSTDALSVTVSGGVVSIPRAAVFRVALLGKSKRPRNAAIGLAAGCAAGLVAGAALDSSFSEDGEHLGKTIFTPIGCGAGAAIGAAIPGFETVYRAPKGALNATRAK